MTEQGIDSATTTNGTGGLGGQAMPLFYRGPHPVSSTRHAKHGILGKADLSFARGTNVIPLNIGETAAAAKFYPIIFSAEPPHLPVLICGLQQGENVFVTDSNRWAQNTYVPAYVRRYPFIFMESPDHEQLVLSIDETSNLVSEGGDQPLFGDDGKQTEIVERALDFCRAFHQQHRVTREFAAALAEKDLLVDNTTEFRLGENRRIELTGYKIIDSKKFDSLEDELILDWRKRGWLPAVYYHMQSLSNWPNLFHQAAARAAERGEAGDTTGDTADEAVQTAE